jgi:hypothetical protein
LIGLLAGALCAVSQAWAAGGAHIVDDSEPETPGLCHVEFWVAAFLTGDQIGNAAPACTLPKIPWLEMGAAYDQYWGSVSAPLFGPAFKVNLVPEKNGLGIGIGLNSSVNLETGTVGLASTILLVSVPINDRVRFNANAGWSYVVTAASPDAVFYGGHFEVDLTKDVMLMVEGFGRSPGVAGTQMGLRFTPNQGNIDFDLLVANYFDPGTTRFITLGVTVRF